ncbi:MAG: hypothetical protein ACLSGS_06645 [Adlercreutzia sp.]
MGPRPAHIEGTIPTAYAEYLNARSKIENDELDDDTYRMIKATTKGVESTTQHDHLCDAPTYPDRYKDGYGATTIASN